MRYTGARNRRTKFSAIPRKQNNRSHVQMSRNNIKEVDQSKLIHSDIKLTISILVSNRVKYIRKTMESIKPLLEAIPSELVILDTMGEKGDGSIDIVREYTDKIYPFTWCNDFSAARNACLDHAKGEWFMFMDDDEHFDDVQELIDFFQSGESENYYTGYYYVRSYLVDGSYSTGVVGRMIRRMETTRFVGRVHEGFNQMLLPGKQFSCFVHHYGYIYANDKEREKKQQRNVPLLRADIEENGLTPLRAAQLVQELLVRDATREEGYRFCMESIAELEKRGELHHSCSQWLLSASVRCLGKENAQKALSQAEEIYSRYKMTEVGAMVFAFTTIIIAMGETDKNLALLKKYSDIYLNNWDWKQEHEQLAIAQSNLDFPNFMTEQSYHYVIHVAASVANKMEDYTLANQYWKRMPWDKVDGKLYMVDLNNTIQGLKKQQEQEKITAKLREFLAVLDSLKDAMIYYMTSMEENSLQEQQEFLTGMQETAITIGTGLDKLLGENTEEVSLLEKFCELVWSCNNASTREEKQELVISMQQAAEEVAEKLKDRAIK